MASHRTLVYCTLTLLCISRSLAEIVDDSNGRISYDTQWTVDTNSLYYNQSYHRVPQPGAQATFQFTGTAITLYASTHNDGADFSFSLSEGPKKTCTTFANSDTSVFAAAVCSLDNLKASTTHTLTVQHAGIEGRWIGIDYLNVTTSSTTSSRRTTTRRASPTTNDDGPTTAPPPALTTPADPPHSVSVAPISLSDIVPESVTIHISKPTHTIKRKKKSSGTAIGAGIGGAIAALLVGVGGGAYAWVLRKRGREDRSEEEGQQSNDNLVDDDGDGRADTSEPQAPSSPRQSIHDNGRDPDDLVADSSNPSHSFGSPHDNAQPMSFVGDIVSKP